MQYILDVDDDNYFNMIFYESVLRNLPFIEKVTPVENTVNLEKLAEMNDHELNNQQLKQIGNAE